MGLFDMNEKKLQALYHKASVDSGRGAVTPRQNRNLDKAVTQYAKQNHCSFDRAWGVAKTGRKSK